MWDLTTQSLLTDLGPSDVSHNLSASALRRGLAVNAFALLETYLQSRFEELLAQLSNSPLSYASFSNELRALLTLNATIGLATKVGYAAKADKLAMAEGGISRIAGYAATPPVYTAFGFSPKGSNVYKDDVGTCLTALGAIKPWNQMADVASAIGSTRVDISVDFDNIARTRNQCAHNSRSSIPTIDLQTHLECVTLIGIGFDVIATSIVKEICSTTTAADLATVSSRAVRPFRFLDHQIDGTWAERATLNGRNVKAYQTEQTARSGVMTRVNSGARFHILRNTQKIPLELL